ncbi:MAG: orotate phosphoribosyltransferase [Alphaproteobacteria bacterium]|nr:MAG: orotate phosphoribosyltransferase [Alphaproteobacteria bacterium]TAF13599.1 MAG: orotate phosphoribosyltransferase [Alphaproteobacteria bacterium]TAF39167.1 MAG: orotate phosphoribosyltransferase [Alphaproteobacteria bacterium]TAF74960.1 MAG: orotate phosphoribosyltransferase [Alphaproteobacteria bacterium]
MNDETIINEFINAGALLKGHFILSSGLHSDTYLQCARVLMDTKRADRLCAALAQKIRDAMGENLPDVIVAPAMGGVIVGYEMGRQLGIPTMFCERVDGSFTLRRGFTLEAGQKVLLVEDVVTTGKSSLETVACVESYGAKVVAEASLVDRSNGTHALPFALYALLTLDVTTYAPNALPAHLQGTEAIKPGSRWLK